MDTLPLDLLISIWEDLEPSHVIRYLGLFLPRTLTLVGTLSSLGPESSQLVCSAWHSAIWSHRRSLSLYAAQTQWIPHIVGRLYGLTSLTLHGAPPIAIKLFATILALPSLDRLSMNGASWEPLLTNPFNVHPAPPSPKLSFLQLNSGRKFRSSHLMWFLPFSPSLTHLDLRGNQKLDDAGVEKHISKFRSLKYLRLTRCLALTETSLAALAPSLPLMTSINLSDTKASDATVKSWLTSCPKLTQLEVGRSSLTSTSLNIVGKLGSALRRLNLQSHSHFSDTSVEHLSTLSNLETLNLASCSRLTGDCVVHTLGRLTSLTNLTIDRCRMNDFEFSYVSKLTSLRRLSVANCFEIDGDALAPLSSSLTQLIALNLSACDLQPDNFVHLGQFYSLTELNLAQCMIKDACLPYLGRLKNLTSLDISRSQVTDNALHHLRNLHKLSTLSLSHVSALTDAGLEHVAAISSLMQLDLSWNYEITSEGLACIIEMPRLISIDLSYCSAVSDTFLEHVHNEKGLNFFMRINED